MKKIYHIQPEPGCGPEGYRGPLDVEPDDFFADGSVGYRMNVQRDNETGASYTHWHMMSRNEYSPLDFALGELLAELYPEQEQC